MTLFSAPNYCGEFDNAGAMMSVDETLLCSFQVRILLSWILLIYNHILLVTDPETSREESQIPIRRDEYGTTCNTTPQAKEEGCQDGLRADDQGRGWW